MTNTKAAQPSRLREVRTRGSRVLAVTRHAGAREWLSRQGLAPDIVTPHLSAEDEAALRRGDTIVGILPLPIVARLTAEGVRCVLISLTVPPEDRGRELTADDMDRLGAELSIVTVTVEPWRPGQEEAE